MVDVLCLRRVDDAASFALTRPLGGAPGFLVPTVEDGSPDEERHRRGDEESDERPDDEEAEVAHRGSRRGRTIEPSARIEGTQSPTKIACSLYPVNQSETESTKETAAAQRSKRRDACSWPPVTRITVDSTWWMYEMVDLPVYD